MPIPAFTLPLPLPFSSPNPPPVATPRRTRIPHACTPAPLPPGEQLVRASMLGDLPTIQTLLSTGTSPSHASLQNNSLMTALMWSASEGNVPITTTLLQAHASVNDANSHNLTALIYAFDNLPNANPRPAPPPGFPSRSPASAQSTPRIIPPRVTGHSNVADMLVQAGASVFVKNAYGETLVHMAARKCQTAWVERLLAAGVGVDVRSAGYEETALHVAAKEGHVEVVEVLLRNGARVDARSRFGWTPLIWAVACGGVDVATVLLQAGADGALWTYGVDGGKGTCAVEEARRCARPDDMARVLRKWGGV